MLCENTPMEWDALSPSDTDDQIAVYDEMRGRCPIAYSDQMGWTLFRHEDILRVLRDHASFSNQVSRHVSVPNGMDPPEHTAYRALVEQCFEGERIARYEPTCRRIAAGLLQALPTDGNVEIMAEFARPFAVAAQTAYLGWPACLQQPLLAWVARQQAAAAAGDRAALASAAYEFDGYIRALLAQRRASDPSLTQDDLTQWLMSAMVDGRPLTDDEMVSILRNWTVGELGTLAACVGILAHFLIHRPDIQDMLRAHPQHIPAAIDEILRIHAPLVANRRVSTRPVEIAGQILAAGERLTLLWASANRDEAVFGDPDEFRLDRDPALNLLYGAGIHVCPGAGLARAELRVVMTQLLGCSASLEVVPDCDPVLARYPVSGFSSLTLRIRRA